MSFLGPDACKVIEYSKIPAERIIGRLAYCAALNHLPDQTTWRLIEQREKVTPLQSQERAKVSGV